MAWREPGSIPRATAIYEAVHRSGLGAQCFRERVMWFLPARPRSALLFLLRHVFCSSPTGIPRSGGPGKQRDLLTWLSECPM